MAIIKASKGGKTLSKAINYAAKDKIVSGINCPDDKKLACEQMNMTKELFDKEDGRLYKPYVQSFAPGEVSPELAHKIGKEFAEKAFPGFEVIVGTHTESKSGVIHNHVVVNSVSFEDGHKIQTDKKDLERFKAISDDLCREHGLSVIDRSKTREKGTVVAWDRDKYQVITNALKGKGKSHLVDIARGVDKALTETAGMGMKAFQDNLKAQGITYYERSEKGITFANSDGKATGATLAKTFTNPDFQKENILKIVKQREVERPSVMTMPVSEWKVKIKTECNRLSSTEQYHNNQVRELNKQINAIHQPYFKQAGEQLYKPTYERDMADNDAKHAKIYEDTVKHNKSASSLYNQIFSSRQIEIDRDELIARKAKADRERAEIVKSYESKIKDIEQGKFPDSDRHFMDRKISKIIIERATALAKVNDPNYDNKVNPLQEKIKQHTAHAISVSKDASRYNDLSRKFSKFRESYNLTLPINKSHHANSSSAPSTNILSAVSNLLDRGADKNASLDSRTKGDDLSCVDWSALDDVDRRALEMEIKERGPSR